MVLRRGRIGSIPDAIQYDDGDYATAVEVDDPIRVNAAPANANDVLRLVDAPFGLAIAASASIVTGSRFIGQTYHNTSTGVVIVQITIRLSEIPLTVPPTTLPVTTIPPATTLAPTTAPPYYEAIAVFETDAGDPPATETARAAKNLGFDEYLELTITALVRPGEYYRLREVNPVVSILNWVEYTISLG